jgi:hypothetical protein
MIDQTNQQRYLDWEAYKDIQIVKRNSKCNKIKFISDTGR